MCLSTNQFIYFERFQEYIGYDLQKLLRVNCVEIILGQTPNGYTYVITYRNLQLALNFEEL